MHLREVKGERILAVITARRKRNQKEFLLGVGIVLGSNEEPNGQIRIRNEQMDSGVWLLRHQ